MQGFQGRRNSATVLWGRQNFSKYFLMQESIWFPLEISSFFEFALVAMDINSSVEFTLCNPHCDCIPLNVEPLPLEQQLVRSYRISATRQNGRGHSSVVKRIAISLVWPTRKPIMLYLCLASVVMHTLQTVNSEGTNAAVRPFAWNIRYHRCRVKSYGRKRSNSISTPLAGDAAQFIDSHYFGRFFRKLNFASITTFFGSSKPVRKMSSTQY